MHLLGLGHQEDVHPPVTHRSHGQAAQRVHPGTLRRTVMFRPFHAGVDMVTIARWQGDANVAITSI